jgi:hypothetical protein
MIITVTNELDIATEHEGLIAIIASVRGWNSDMVDENEQPITALDYFQNNVLKPNLSAFYSGLASECVSAWYGLSQGNLAETISTLVKEKLTTTVTVE